MHFKVYKKSVNFKNVKPHPEVLSLRPNLFIFFPAVGCQIVTLWYTAGDSGELPNSQYNSVRAHSGLEK